MHLWQGSDYYRLLSILRSRSLHRLKHTRLSNNNGSKFNLQFQEIIILMYWSAVLFLSMRINQGCSVATIFENVLCGVDFIAGLIRLKSNHALVSRYLIPMTMPAYLDMLEGNKHIQLLVFRWWAHDTSNNATVKLVKSFFFSSFTVERVNGYIWKW